MTVSRYPFQRILLKYTLKHTAAALVISAVTAGFYSNRLYMVYAMCAAGSLLIAWGWLHKDNQKERKEAVPEMFHRKIRRFRKPAFLMTNSDFNDDLTAYVSTDEELLSEKDRGKVKRLSCLLAGFLMFVLSFLIKI